jgi:membrane protein
VLKRTVQAFGKDDLSDWAAALTYYSVLSIFPAVIVLTAVLGLLGPSATQTLIDNINTMVPGQGRDILITAIKELQHSESLAGPLAIIGLAGALWSASAYIGAFIRASNAIYEMPEGRPIWKTIPLRLGLTLGVVVLLALCAVGVVVSGTVADRAGRILGIGSTGVLVWNIAKWPVLAVLGVPQRKATRVPLAQPWRCARCRDLGAGICRIRGLRGQFQFLQQDLRLAGRGDRLFGVAVDF